jgi:putative spermidine/putrescine transport system substrate-binding protein
MSRIDSPINRKRRATILAGAASALTVVMPRLSQAQTGQLTSNVAGGFYEQVYRKTVSGPFEKQFGAKVDLRYGAYSAILTNALVNRGNPEIDVLLLSYPDSIRAVHEDIGIPLTPADIPNLADVFPIWWDQYRRQGVGLDYITFGIMYRKDLVKTVPASWADLWKDEYKGRLAVPGIASAGAWEFLVAAAKNNGGDEGNLTPGFEAIRRLKPNVRKFFQSTAEPVPLIESGEVALAAMVVDARAFALMDAGKPVGFVTPKEGAAVGMVSYHVAKNSKNQDLAKKFINFALSVETQTALCNGLVAGPVNRKVRIDPKIAMRVTPYDRLQFFDWLKIVPNMPALVERWNREIGG